MDFIKILFELKDKASLLNDKIYQLQNARINYIFDLTVLILDFQLDNEGDILLFELELNEIHQILRDISSLIEHNRILFDAMLDKLENFRI